MVEITSHDVAAFQEWGSHQLREVVDTLRAAKARVEAGTLTAARFAELETVIGFRWNPDGLLAAGIQGVHLTHTVTYDWVHSLLQDGVFNSEL